MLSALLLFAAAVTSQDVVERITVQHTPAYDVFKAITDENAKIKESFAGVKRVTYDPTDNSLIVQGSREGIAELRDFIRKLDEQNAKPQEPTKLIPLKNRSAQYIYEMVTMTGRFKSDIAGTGWVPKDLTLSVDQRTNSIAAQGSDASIREIELLLMQFDIKSMQVVVEVEASVPLMDRTFSTSGRIANNSSLNYVDDATDTRLKVTPRVNGDKTITFFVTGGALGTNATATFRVASGESTAVRIYPGQRRNQQSGDMENSILAEYLTGQIPDGFLKGADLPRHLVMRSVIDGPVALGPKEAELRLVIKVTLPVQ